MDDDVEIIGRIYYITMEGQKRSLTEWCKIKRRRYILVYRRIREGWPVSKAFNKPRRQARKSSQGQPCSECNCDISYHNKEHKRVKHRNGSVTWTCCECIDSRKEWNAFEAAWLKLFRHDSGARTA